MTTESDNGLKELPVAVVRERRTFSVVWIIPLVAIVIAAWLAWEALSEQGPRVTIHFKSAEGLEAGKTKVKYKDVDVGLVEDIYFSDDLSHVVVDATLDRAMVDHLTDSARFWIVSPQISATQVSGLGTLLSGPYIGMEPGRPGERRRQFEGLPKAPLVTMDTPGTYFRLRSVRLGSLSFGSPVYYHQIKVGQVVNYRLEEDGNYVTVDIFVESPHDRRVYPRTRFWNAGGIDVRMDADGFRMHTESLTSLLLGGIGFDTHREEMVGDPAGDDAEFPLFESREASLQREYLEKSNYLLYFDGSARGLSSGAPVELLGMRTGTVTDVKLEFDVASKQFRVRVLVEIEPERVAIVGLQPGEELSESIMAELVARGLRAQLKSGNILTGQLVVSLDIYPDAPVAVLGEEDGRQVLPTVPTDIDEIKSGLLQVVGKIQRMPLEEIGRNLNETLAGINRLVNDGGIGDTVGSLNQAAKQLELTLAEIQLTAKSLGKGSPAYADLLRTLAELSEAARSLRLMTDYLERHPDALLKGRAR